MKAIPFEGQNVIIAENQEEYQPLPAYVGPVQTADCPICRANTKKECGYCSNQRKVPLEGATFCFQLEPGEIAQIVKTGQIWHTVLTFGNALQPVLMTFEKPAHLTK